MNQLKLFSVIPYKNKFIKLENANSARAYYRSYSIDLLSGERSPLVFDQWIAIYQNLLLSSHIEKPRVIHLFYELGFLIEKEFDLLSDNTLLAIDIEYESFSEIKFSKITEIKLNAESSPDFTEYKKSV